MFAALTAQNPRGVRSVHPVPCDFIADQLDAVFEMYNIKALKTGMLATAETVETVAAQLRKYPRVKKVIDPVMVATSGARLLADDAVEAMQKLLLPQATLITPNLPEAETLLGVSITNETQMREAAKALSKKFGVAVLLKGGHALHSALRTPHSALDVLFDGRRFYTFSLPVIAHPVSTHGTGCTLAAALAAELALGASLPKAVAGAKKVVYESIKLSYYIGRNCGVLGMPWANEQKGD